MSGLSYRSRSGRWVLAATVGGSVIASIDSTVVGIALPAIGRDFGIGVAWFAVGCAVARPRPPVAAAGITGAAYLDAGRFQPGFQRAAVLCAAACVVAGAVSALTIRGGGRARRRFHPPHGRLDGPPPAGHSTAAGAGPAPRSANTQTAHCSRTTKRANVGSPATKARRRDERPDDPVHRFRSR